MCVYCSRVKMRLSRFVFQNASFNNVYSVVIFSDHLQGCSQGSRGDSWPLRGERVGHRHPCTTYWSNRLQETRNRRRDGTIAGGAIPVATTTVVIIATVTTVIILIPIVPVSPTPTDKRVGIGQHLHHLLSSHPHRRRQPPLAYDRRYTRDSHRIDSGLTGKNIIDCARV